MREGYLRHKRRLYIDGIYYMEDYHPWPFRLTNPEYFGSSFWGTPMWWGYRTNETL